MMNMNSLELASLKSLNRFNGIRKAIQTIKTTPTFSNLRAQVQISSRISKRIPTSSTISIH